MGAADRDEGTNMQVSTALKIGAGAIAVSAVVVLAGCAQSAAKGPFAGITNSLMDSLKPGNRGVLELSADSVREVRRGDGSLQGSFDGTRLLVAADTHAYGEAAGFDAAKDRAGDGRATFNEVRQVVSSFDANGDLAFDGDETKAFEAATGGVQWRAGEPER
ncbi:MAG: hypothetical protein JWN72_1950 [Thermoleophilia bacterium]|nr:hypothetical protein [Thermoleophilia bacterium]